MTSGDGVAAVVVVVVVAVVVVGAGVVFVVVVVVVVVVSVAGRLSPAPTPSLLPHTPLSINIWMVSVFVFLRTVRRRPIVSIHCLDY